MIASIHDIMSNPAARFKGRLTGAALTLLLMALPVTLVLGHRGGAARGLSLWHSYISEYESSAPHWPWIIVSIFICSAAMLVVAGGVIRRAGTRRLVVLGAMIIATSVTPSFFIAYAPVRTVEQPLPRHLSPWAPGSWFLSQTARTPFEEGQASAYSVEHFQATRLAIVLGLAGVTVLALGLWSLNGWERFARVTLACAMLMSLLFEIGDQSAHWHGLWQRLGLGVLYAWLWTVRARLGRRSRRFQRHEASPARVRATFHLR
jgi:hypothetical protein